MTRFALAAAMAAALALPPAADAATPSKAKVHGIALSGRVTRVDAKTKTLTVVDASGQEVSLAWTGATKITGGELKAGEVVTLRYLDRDKKHIATTIHVGPMATAAAPKAATPRPAPTGSPAPASPSPAAR